MINPKTIYLSLLFLCIFTNCSTAQQKPSAELPVKIGESSDKVNPQTNRFESKEGKFSINISQAPSTIRDIEGEEEHRNGKQFVWQFERTAYSVMYTPIKENYLSQAFDKMNSGIRKTIQKKFTESFSENEISVDKYPAKEFRFVATNGARQIQRTLLVNNMGYLVAVSYLDEESEKEVLKILDSFKPLNEKK